MKKDMTELLLKNAETFKQQSEIMNSEAVQDSVKLLKTYQNNNMNKLLETTQQIAQSYSNVTSQFTFLQKYSEIIQPITINLWKSPRKGLTILLTKLVK